MLQAAFRFNALFSMLSGLAFVIAPAFFATLVGIGPKGFVFLGVNLLFFALMLLGLSTQWAMQRRWISVLGALVVIMDILWVAGSLFLASIPSMASDSGKMLIQGIALIVGSFALWQLIAIIKMVRLRPKNRRNTSMATTAGLALLLPMLAGCTLADVRTPSIHAAQPDSSLIEKGIALLDRVAESHGYSTWKAFHTQEVIFSDRWQADGFWPAQEQMLSLKSMPGTFTAMATLLDGPKAGEQWGLQSWRPYVRDVAGNLSFEPAQEAATAQTFYIPSLQYFNELPFRLLKADHMAYAGEREYRDRTYDLLFVTWGSFEPNVSHDQYLLWIDRETLLISMCQYTIRSAAPAFTGTIHFEDYRAVQGVYFPFKQTVILPAPENTLYPLDKYFFHQSLVESVTFDGFDKELLIVDASLVPRDVKP